MISAQNTEIYLTLLKEGRIDQVREILPELLSQFPNDPEVKFLKALTTTDGDAAMTQFRTLIESYPNFRHADEVLMKIGGYLFARGLYSQASIQYRSIPMLFPQSDQLQRAIDLMVNSYQATGEVDSAVYYLKRFQKKYSHLDYAKYGIPDLIEPQGAVSLVKLEETNARKRIATSRPRSVDKRIPIKMKDNSFRPWVVQVGAFSKYENARRLKDQMMKEGYPVVIEELASQGRRLYAVRVVRFGSREEARNKGQEIKTLFGLEFRVLNRPE